MKIHLVSDLHVEFGEYPYTPPECDVMLFAGDVGERQHGVETVLRLARHCKRAFWTPGNHEFYNTTREEWLKKTTEALEFSTVTILDNNWEIYEDVAFFGSTFWSDCRTERFTDTESYRKLVEQCLADFNRYRGIHLPCGRIVRCEDLEHWHQESVKALEAFLARDFTTSVVMSHFSPSRALVHSKYAGDSLSNYFNAGCNELVASSNASLWVFGHTHCPVDTQIGNTRCVSNPWGYPHESKTGFDPQLIIEIG